MTNSAFQSGDARKTPISALAHTRQDKFNKYVLFLIRSNRVA